MINGALGVVQVDDARSAAAGAGWVVSVISTAFTPAVRPLRFLVTGLVLAAAVAAGCAPPARGSGMVSIACFAPVVTGSIGLRLVDVPVATADDPRARLYIVDHLAPGAVIRRRIEVSNTTSATARVALYAAAGSITRGTFVGATDRTANELSSWTSVRPGSSDVPAGGAVTATVTVAVPTDTAPGEQYAVAWAEVRAPAASGGVSQVSRVGLRLYLSVGPGGAPAADFTVDSLTAGRLADGARRSSPPCTTPAAGRWT